MLPLGWEVNKDKLGGRQSVHEGAPASTLRRFVKRHDEASRSSFGLKLALGLKQCSTRNQICGDTGPKPKRGRVLGGVR
jgi:hypothetical protein